MKKIGKSIETPLMVKPRPMHVMEQSKELCKRSEDIVKSFPRSTDFLEQFNYDFCLQRYENIKSSKDALTSNKIKLNEIGKAYNRQIPKSLLEFWSINLAAFMNVEITDQQSRQLSTLAYDEIFFLNLAELTLLFNRIRKEYYGSFYGKFNGQLILRACREYRSERGKILCSLSSDEQLKYI